jgi:hypothetical protein
MTDYPFDQILAADPSNPDIVASNGVVTLFAPGDATKTPLTLKTLNGLPLPNPVTVNKLGFGPAYIAPLWEVAWEGGGLSGLFRSNVGLRDETVAALGAAQGAQAAAEAAAANAAAEVEVALSGAVGDAQSAANAAAASAALVGAPAGAAIAAAINGNPEVKGELSATYLGKWKPNTYYIAGDSVLNPSGDTVTAKVNFTSGASYDAANWNISAAYVSGSSGLPLQNGAAVPGGLRTRSGRSHVVVAGVIRNYNDGAGWVLITDGFHPPIGITSVDSLTDTGLIRVNYTNLKVGGGNAGRTVTLIAVPDETLTKAGFTCGASVSPDFANLQLQQTRPLNDRVAWDTASGTYKLWKNDFDSRGANRSPFTVNSATNNHLILGHPQAVMDDRFDIGVQRIGGIGENYTPTISTSQAETILTQVTINFWTPTLTGSATKDWPSLADGAMASQTVTVTGCAVGDIAQASMSVALPAGMQLTAAVTAADTVTVTLINHSGAVQDLASGTLTAITRKASGGDYRVTTPDSKCRALVNRGMMRSYVAPADVNETTYPSSNIWILGIMQDQNLA